MTAKTASPSKRRRKKKVKEIEIVEYIAQIDGWEADISLRPGLSTYRKEVYWEQLGVTLACRLLCPEKVRGRCIRVTINGDREVSRKLMEPVDDLNTKPAVSVGYLNQVRLDYSSYAYLVASIEHIHPILTLLTSGHFRFVEMRGDKLRYGSATIRSWDMRSKLDPEEVPEGVVVLPPLKLDPSPPVEAPPVRSD